MKKFGAKRITALTMALALGTIGGVYATWSFADDTAASSEKSFSIAISGLTTSSASGTYSIEKSALIYRVEQYSYANDTKYTVDDAAYTSNGEVSYNDTTYSWVQTGGGTTTEISPTTNTNDTTTVTTLNNYLYNDDYDSSNNNEGTLYYKTITDTTVTNSTAGTTSYTSNRGEVTATTTETSGVATHTAALCVITGSYLRIRFTPGTGASTNVTKYGIATSFNFSWNNDAKFAYDTSTGYYDSTQEESSIFNLDTTSYVIRPSNESGSADRYWTEDGDGSFYYDIEGEDLVTYLTINKIILENSSQYKTFSSAASSASFYLNVKEDTKISLTAPSINGSTSGNAVAVTISDVNNVSTNVKNYRLCIYDESESSLVGTITIPTADISGTFSLTTDYFKHLNSGNYIVRVRAISDSEDYEDSLLSSGISVNYTGSAVSYTGTVSANTGG